MVTNFDSGYGSGQNFLQCEVPVTDEMSCLEAGRERGSGCAEVLGEDQIGTAVVEALAAKLAQEGLAGGAAAGWDQAAGGSCQDLA